MKAVCLTTMIAVLSFCTVGIQAQTSQTKLDQVELMKQFVGTWETEIGKDTSAYWDMEPYGSGYVASLKYITKGKIVKEGKGLYGYDKKIDKIIEAGITKGKDIGVYVMWFITESKFVLIPFSDLAHPEKASFVMEGEFNFPDILLENTLIEKKTVKTKTWRNPGVKKGRALKNPAGQDFSKRLSY